MTAPTRRIDQSPEKVVPFACGFDPPIPGESLLGFFSRCSSRTTVTQLKNLLELGGVKKPMATSICTTLTDDREIGGLAKLLRTTPEEIRSRTYKAGTFEHTFSETIDFFGVKIRSQYRNSGHGRRRVSPRALEISEHHRAIWEITAFSFDPETMETLLSNCPVCGHELNWRRLQGVAKCDRCRDADGRPSVDLRDFPQPIMETADPEALAFVVGLIDPIKDNRKVRSLLKQPWSDFSNSDLFETVIALASGFCAKPEGANAQGRPKKWEDFARITPDHLALAGRAIIGGADGFAGLAEEYRKPRDARPSFYGLRKEFGPLAYVGYDRHLAPGVADLISRQLKGYLRATELKLRPVKPQKPTVLKPARLQKERSLLLNPKLQEQRLRAREERTLLRELERRDRARHLKGRKDRDASFEAHGYHTIQKLGVMLEMRTEPLTRLARSGLVEAIRADGADRSPVRMKLSEVAPAAALYKDSIVEKEAAGTLGIPRYLLPHLAELRHLERLTGAVLGMTMSPVAFRRSSVEQLRQKLWAQVGSPPPTAALRLKRAATALGAKRPPWLQIVLAITEGRLRAWAKRDKRRNILKHLFVRDAEALAGILAETREEEALLPEWLDIAAAAGMLEVNEAFVWRLAKAYPEPKLLPRHDNGYTPFRTEDVEKLAKSHIFVPEISRRTAITPRLIKTWLREQGVKDDFALMENRMLGFLREKVEPKIAALMKANPKKPPRTEPHPVKVKLRIVRAVESGTSISQAARDAGVGFGVARKWVIRWRKAGSVAATGKGGYKSKLDQHADWLRACVRDREGISLSELVEALKAEKKVKTSSTAVWQCLERHKIVLAARRRRRSPTLIAAE